MSSINDILRAQMQSQDSVERIIVTPAKLETNTANSDNQFDNSNNKLDFSSGVPFLEVVDENSKAFAERVLKAEYVSKSLVFASTKSLNLPEKDFVKMVFEGLTKYWPDIPSRLYAVAHACCECGYGKSTIGYNVWGMKFFPRYYANMRNMPVFKGHTKEDVSTGTITIVDMFPILPNIESGVACYREWLRGRSYRAGLTMGPEGWVKHYIPVWMTKKGGIDIVLNAAEILRNKYSFLIH